MDYAKPNASLTLSMIARPVHVFLSHARFPLPHHA